MNALKPTYFERAENKAADYCSVNSKIMQRHTYQNWFKAKLAHTKFS